MSSSLEGDRSRTWAKLAQPEADASGSGQAGRADPETTIETLRRGPLVPSGYCQVRNFVVPGLSRTELTCHDGR
jgi:hypothetical protein